MMAPLPVDKLAKLIPLLASDHDGEVVSAARAISRALKAATCDFHDIVKALGTVPQPNSAYERQRADMARTGAFYSSPFEDAMRGADTPEIKRVAPRLFSGGKMSAKEDRFVRSLWSSASKDPAFVMTPAERERWDGILGRSL